MEELLPVAVRAVERLIVVFAGLWLIYLGYRLTTRKNRGAPTGEINVHFKDAVGVVLKNHGPGFLTLTLGAALLGFSFFYGMSTFSIGTTQLRFFNKKETGTDERNEWATQVAQLRQLEELCKRKTSGLLAIDCSTLAVSRKNLASVYFPTERTMFDKAMNGGAASLDQDRRRELNFLFGE
jgi:hypothetical protein